MRRIPSSSSSSSGFADGTGDCRPYAQWVFRCFMFLMPAQSGTTYLGTNSSTRGVVYLQHKSNFTFLRKCTTSRKVFTLFDLKRSTSVQYLPSKSYSERVIAYYSVELHGLSCLLLGNQSGSSTIFILANQLFANLCPVIRQFRLRSSL